MSHAFTAAVTVPKHAAQLILSPEQIRKPFSHSLTLSSPQTEPNESAGELGVREHMERSHLTP